MGRIKKYKEVFIIVLVLLVGVFFLGRMYHNNVKALTDFSTSYERFDSAISNVPIDTVSDLNRKAEEALARLIAQSSVRISSLIKNDRELMSAEREIADVSGKELASLKAYTVAIQNNSADLSERSKEYADLIGKRKAAYAHFQELAAY